MKQTSSQNSECSHFYLKMETICSTETTVIIWKPARRHNPRDHNQWLHCRENLKTLIADITSAVQFHRPLWDSKIYYPVHKGQPLVSDLIQIQPVHTLTHFTRLSASQGLCFVEIRQTGKCRLIITGWLYTIPAFA